jgi:FkbM family methyltransferase
MVSWKTHINGLMAKLGYRIVRRKIDLLDVLRLKNVDLVIDIGANEGQFGLSLRRRGYYGRIASFEPIPEVYARLRQLSSRDANWSTHDLALGDYDGYARLRVAKSSQLSSFVTSTKWNEDRESNVAQVRCETVAIRCLDSIFPELIADRPFLKVDVQGAEEKVLRGAKESLSRVVGVQLEIALYEFYEGQLLLQESLRLMDGLGFVPAFIDPIGYYDATDPCRVMEMDCVFVRRLHLT